MNLPTYERACTIALLHRFFRMSLQLGRMPSLLGGEVFRARIRSTGAHPLEDAVIFVCDVERCLASLEPPERRLLAFCIFQEHTEWEAARRFHCTRSEISRRLGGTLDLLYDTFCRIGLLCRPAPRVQGLKGVEELKG